MARYCKWLCRFPWVDTALRKPDLLSRRLLRYCASAPRVSLLWGSANPFRKLQALKLSARVDKQSSSRRRSLIRKRCRWPWRTWNPPWIETIVPWKCWCKWLPSFGLNTFQGCSKSAAPSTGAGYCLWSCWGRYCHRPSFDRESDLSWPFDFYNILIDLSVSFRCSLHFGSLKLTILVSFINMKLAKKKIIAPAKLTDSKV